MSTPQETTPMATASFATDTGTIRTHAAAPDVSAINDDPPKGARPEDYDRRGIEETLAMFDDPGECSVTDLFGIAVNGDGIVEGEGSTWFAHEDYTRGGDVGGSGSPLHGATGGGSPALPVRNCVALFGVTATSRNRSQLPFNWIKAARAALDAEDAAAA